MRLLVTGGSGFIGSAVVRAGIRRGWQIINVDKLTYAATEGSTREVAENDSYLFERVDICERDAVRELFEQHRPTAVMHLAAESHVDRSIDEPGVFVDTNVVGTSVLLAAATDYFERLPAADRDRFRFHHVSTDEVFGSLGPVGAFTPESPYAPRSPYSATKAAADHLVSAWLHTFGLPTIISNCSNNYGPFQFPEKLIPLAIVKAIHGEQIPVYGSGSNVRDWLFVDDHAEALLQIVFEGEVGATYLVGGGSERTNLQVVETVCAVLDELRPETAHRGLIEFVADRPGHDQRYAVDYSGTTEALGWRPGVTFEEGLRRTVDWYLGNEDWWRPLVDRHQAIDRRGRGTEAL